MLIPQEQEEKPHKEPQLSPEALKVAETYLSTMDIGETANNLNLLPSDVTKMLAKKEVKAFINTVVTSVAMKNMDSVSSRMEDIIAKKLEELEEAEATSSKDIADLLSLQHKFMKERLELEIKMMQAAREEGPKTQQNNQFNFGNQWAELVQQLKR